MRTLTGRPSAALLCLLMTLAGCGYVGDPLPPLLNIPARVTDLAAVQRGDRIVVQFSVPRMSTEGTTLRHPPQLDLRAGPAPAPFDANTWAAQAKQLGEGPVENWRARYEVPVNGWPGQEIVFGVRAVGANGRDAGWSNLAAVAVAPPPRPPAALLAEAAPEGVRLTWQGAAAQYRVYRRGPGEEAFTRAGDAAGNEWTDRAAEYGKTYAYRVQAIVKTATGEAESELSPAVAVTPVDRFPPAVPTGLMAVASTGSIELVWERNTERDLAGYRIYRAAPGGGFTRIGESGENPSYSDRAVEAGKTYRYAVTAVDKSGNESKPSAAAEATAP